MSIIRSHDITLCGGNDKYKVILCPLSDEHLPYLYKWNSDSEVLYWTEGEDIENYPPEVVHRGIGTLFIGMLVKYAFECEHVDVLHCFCEDYNIRSRRVWEKNGFQLVFTEKIPQPHKGKLQYHWRLTKDEYQERKVETL